MCSALTRSLSLFLVLCFREDNRNTLGLACSCLCIWQNAATAYVAHGRLPAHTLYRGFDLELERGKVAERERERGARYARDGNQSRRPAHDDDDDEEKLYALIQYIDVGQKCATCLSAIAAAPFVYPYSRLYLYSVRNGSLCSPQP